MNNKDVMDKVRKTFERYDNQFTNYVTDIYLPTVKSGDEEEVENVTKERDRLYEQKEYWQIILRALIMYTERPTPVTQDFSDSFKKLKKIEVLTMINTLNNSLRILNKNIYIRTRAGSFLDENVYFGEICLGNTFGFIDDILRPNDQIVNLITEFFKDKNITIEFNDSRTCFVLKNVIFDLQDTQFLTFNTKK